MFLKEWITIVSKKGPKGGTYREDWGWRYGKYIYVGKRTCPCTLYIILLAKFVVVPHANMTGLQSYFLCLYSWIFLVFFAGRSIVWVLENVRQWVPPHTDMHCFLRAAGGRGPPDMSCISGLPWKVQKVPWKGALPAQFRGFLSSMTKFPIYFLWYLYLTS